MQQNNIKLTEISQTMCISLIIKHKQTKHDSVHKQEIQVSLSLSHDLQCHRDNERY